jgi:hypothetical protein
MNNRRSFLGQLAGLGLFAILPGAGRVWKAERSVVFVAPTGWGYNLYWTINRLGDTERMWCKRAPSTSCAHPFNAATFERLYVLKPA